MDLNELEPKVPAEEIAAAEAEIEKTDTPQEEPKQEIKEEPKEDKKEKVVPYGALHEERQKRKQLEAQLRQQAERQALAEQRLAELYQHVQKPKADVPPYEVDPLSNLKAELDSTKAQLEETRNFWQQQAEAQRAQQQAVYVTNWARRQASEYARENPDFPDLYQHAQQARFQELTGQGLTPEQAAMQYQREEIELFWAAYQQGFDPSERIANYARQRGYAPKQQKQEPEKKVEQLNKGLEASKSLGNGAPGGKPTIEQIANMSDDEYAEYKKSLGRDRRFYEGTV